jgi:deazaflavin-dependent oxidoreductase (nitroreductase family)
LLPFDYHPNFLQRRVQKLVSRPALARIFSKFLHAVDGPMLKMSGGLRSLTRLLAGVPVVLLTTRGARSGMERTTPLLGLPVEGRIILIASNWGQKHHPAWYYNLKAHPEVTATLDGQTRAYTAREAAGEEYQRYWQMGVRVYPGYTSYVERAGGRHIPVMVLEPRDASRV